MSELQGDMPWIIATLVAIAFFAVVESYAFKHPERTNTLSHAVYTVGSKWPLSIFLMGMFAGGLAVHFFWHWAPPGSISTGMNYEQFLHMWRENPTMTTFHNLGG